jgi:phosphoribosyl-ATP pyrophosphohydrolase
MSSISFVVVPKPDGKEEIMSYDAFVALLFKQESFRHMVDHARGGVCEEAGELSTCLKRHVVYGQELDIMNLIEELGDLRFFMQAVMNLFDIEEQTVLQRNADKLSARYKSLAWTSEDAANRADKNGASEN